MLPDRLPLRLLALGLAAGAALGAAGCGASDYQYVKNSGEGAYLRVPADWKLYDEDQYLDGLGTEGREISGQQLQNLRRGWTVAFDSARRPSVGNVHALVAEAPTGVVRVYPITAQQHDVVSPAFLRNLLGDIDGAIEDGKAHRRRYEELSQDGFRGSRFVFDLDTDDGVVTFDQSAFVNREASKIYVLTMSCSGECYARHESEIDRVAESWTLREP